ncbi:MAG: OmpA family protein [Magnetococcales bacterium]|nr:OmpA family protein [Magnetococcales bacterium]
MAKCPECKPGLPGWLATFGDMMSLLLVFFILLLSFASMDKAKFKEVSGSLKDAFGVQRVKVLTAPAGDLIFANSFSQEVVLVHLMEQVKVVLEKMVDNGEAEVLETEKGFEIQLDDDRLFAQKSTRLKPEIEPVLQQIANLLAPMQNLVHVTGHTDNLPIDATGPFESNWALSAAQAASVVNFFSTKGGVDPTRLESRGAGEFSPRASNDTPEGRAKNRRVEITITRETRAVNANQYTAPTKDFVEGGDVEEGSGAMEASPVLMGTPPTGENRAPP